MKLIILLVLYAVLCSTYAQNNQAKVKNRRDYMDYTKKVLAKNDYRTIISGLGTFKDHLPEVKNALPRKNYREIPTFVKNGIDAAYDSIKATNNGTTQDRINRYIKTRIFTAIEEILFRLIPILGNCFRLFLICLLTLSCEKNVFFSIFHIIILQKPKIHKHILSKK